ncbi:MAG: PQQ-binding-like beta-propeller repeat protein [Bacteriovoracaceae bacterium]|nr:PQQ-binding-like beta-propeller repeat protein [Bacteriovoracaceae bacterium]
MRFAFLVLIFLFGCSQFKNWDIKSPEHSKDFFTIRWAKNLDYTYQPGNLPITYGGVTVANDVIYAGALDGSFRAIDVENGRILWEHLEVKSIAAPALVYGDFIYYGTQSGRLLVRQAISGELKYAIDLGAPIESAPVYHEGRLVIYLRGHQIVCLDAETGKIIWNYRRAVPVTVTLQRTTKPLVIGNKIFVGFADGFAAALSLQEGSMLWEQKLVETQKFVDVDLNPILVDNLIITGSPSGELTGLDPNDGTIRRQFGLSALSHPMVRGQSLLFGNQAGEIVFMTTEGKVLKQKVVSKHGINQTWWWKDHVVAATFGGELLAIDPLTLEVKARFMLGNSQSAVFGDIAQDSQGLGIMSSRNRLYFFE